MARFGETNAGDLASRNVKLSNDKDSITCIFLLPDRVDRTVGFDNARNRYLSGSSDPKGRFAVNVYDLSTGTVRILEGAISLGRSIMEAGVEDTDVVRITRFGSKKDTKFIVQKERRATSEELEAANSEERYDLSKLWTDETKPGGPAPHVPF